MSILFAAVYEEPLRSSKKRKSRKSSLKQNKQPVVSNSVSKKKYKAPKRALAKLSNKSDVKESSSINVELMQIDCPDASSSCEPLNNFVDENITDSIRAKNFLLDEFNKFCTIFSDINIDEYFNFNNVEQIIL